MAWVRGVTAAATRAGSMSRCSSSTSTRTGTAPMRETASAVAMNVLAGRITSPPGPTPTARSASSSASVPLATPMQCADPTNAAYSSSNRLTAGPPTNAVAANTSLETQADLVGDLLVLRGQVDQWHPHALSPISMTSLRTGRAGTPTQVSWLGSSSRSTAPMPSVAPAPTVRFSRTAAFMPM